MRGQKVFRKLTLLENILPWKTAALDERLSSQSLVFLVKSLLRVILAPLPFLLWGYPLSQIVNLGVTWPCSLSYHRKPKVCCLLFSFLLRRVVGPTGWWCPGVTPVDTQRIRWGANDGWFSRDGRMPGERCSPCTRSPFFLDRHVLGSGDWLPRLWVCPASVGNFLS